MRREILQEIQALHDLAAGARSASSTTEVLQAAADRVARLLGAHRVALITFDLAQRRVLDFVRAGPGAQLVDLGVEFEELLSGLSGWVLEHQENALSPAGVDDVRESPEAQRRRRQTGCGSIVVVPLKHREQVLGTLTAINTPDQPDFTEFDADLMRMFANFCAMITDQARLLIELRRAKDDAEASDRAKSEFLAVVSHELRTPLNAILGFTHLLELSGLTEPQRDYTAAIANGGESLLELINNILDLARLEAGELTLARSPVHLKSSLHQVVARARSASISKGLTLNVHLDDALGEVFWGDEARLTQVLNHLVDNAFKFTERGEVSLRVSDGGLEASGQRLVFEVADTGMGIPPEKLSRLFRPFGQVDTSSTRHHGGTGLGLALCHRLVQAMQGEISVRSTLGRGSTFRVSVVLAGVDATTL